MSKTKRERIIEASINAQLSQNYIDCQEKINEILRIMVKGTKLEKDVNWALETCNQFKSLSLNKNYI
ncbi:hypothetical protein P4J13_21095 [Bacillus anthracis]|uniref:hypothetical protein n=1 Tax=Bacillus anthracis TaxID=1392 RepID=UPI002DBB5CEF|nr:hypothetical protein [Bacillus anthracis]MEB9506433.1 hypothetical protein [Bacillus anthracis]